MESDMKTILKGWLFGWMDNFVIISDLPFNENLIKMISRLVAE